MEASVPGGAGPFPASRSRGLEAATSPGDITRDSQAHKRVGKSWALKEEHFTNNYVNGAFPYKPQHLFL